MVALFEPGTVVAHEDDPSPVVDSQFLDQIDNLSHRFIKVSDHCNRGGLGVCFTSIVPSLVWFLLEFPKELFPVFLGYLNVGVRLLKCQVQKEGLVTTFPDPRK